MLWKLYADHRKSFKADLEMARGDISLLEGSWDRGGIIR